MSEKIRDSREIKRRMERKEWDCGKDAANAKEQGEKRLKDLER